MNISTQIDKKTKSIVTAAERPTGDPLPFLKWKYEFDEETGRQAFKSIELSDQSEINEQSVKEAFKRTTGTTDLEVSEKIINMAAMGMTAQRQDVRINQVSSLLPAMKPNDETEALLLGQFLTLQDSGMKCLRLANLPEQGFYHEERLFNLANKLFNTANQTMQTILKYRSKGQQVVQVVHLHNEGQAIVAQNIAPPSRGEGLPKNNAN